MDKEHRPLVERALKQASDPALAGLKSRARLEQVLTKAAKTGDLDVDELGRATSDFGREATVSAFSATDPETGQKMSFAAFLLLLLLLAILAALAGEDSDRGAVLRQAIEALIDSLRSGGGSGGDSDDDGGSDGTENDGRDDEEGR